MNTLIAIVKFPFSLIGTLHKLHKLKKRLETDSAEVMSGENAKIVRLWLECFFVALETGNCNLSHLPGWLRTILAWLLPKTLIDNQIGTFGKNVLKSGKIERDDPTLYDDIRPTFTWRNPPRGAIRGRS